MHVSEPDLPKLHHRTYDVASYRESDTRIRLRGTVRDVKPAGVYIAQDPDPMTIHQMVVDVVVELPAMEIVDAQVVMEVHPHAHCASITGHYEKLVGLSIARGFTHKVRELFGGPRGCTHTTALLQAMAPVATQSIWSMQQPAAGESPVALTAAEQRERVLRNRDTCHVWASDGPMFGLLDAGELIPPPVWARERMKELGLDPDDWYKRNAS
jgi:ATP-dependent Clp protease adapter protein ClpS